MKRLYSFERLNLKEGIEEYLDWVQIAKKKRTTLTNKALLQYFLKFIGDKPLKEICIKDVSLFKGYLESYRDINNKPYATSTIAYYLIAVRQLLKYHMRLGRKILDYELIGIPKYSCKPRYRASREDVEEMVRGIGESNFQSLRDKTIIAFNYASALRVSELIELKVKEGGDTVEEFIESKKSGIIRKVFYDEFVEKLLSKYLVERKKHSTTAYLFISLDRHNYGGMLSTRSIQRIYAQYRLNGLVTPHTTRHGFGSDSARIGENIRFIQKFLGHKSITSTQIYTQLTDKELEAFYKRVSANRLLRTD